MPVTAFGSWASLVSAASCTSRQVALKRFCTSRPASIRFQRRPAVASTTVKPSARSDSSSFAGNAPTDLARNEQESEAETVRLGSAVTRAPTSYPVAGVSSVVEWIC